MSKQIILGGSQLSIPLLMDPSGTTSQQPARAPPKAQQVIIGGQQSKQYTLDVAPLREQPKQIVLGIDWDPEDHYLSEEWPPWTAQDMPQGRPPKEGERYRYPSYRS